MYICPHINEQSKTHHCLQVQLWPDSAHYIHTQQEPQEAHIFHTAALSRVSLQCSHTDSRQKTGRIQHGTPPLRDLLSLLPATQSLKGILSPG